MELKAEKISPNREEKTDFIVTYNHGLGYEIREIEREYEETIIDPETEEETTITVTKKVIQAWGYTEEEKAEQERARKDAMTLTPADVWRALYKAKSLTKDGLLTLIEEQMTGLDMEAIKIEFGASLFYRGAKFGNSKMFDVIGNLLGYTSDDMDYLFEHKELPKQEEPVEENTEEDSIDTNNTTEENIE